MGMSMTTKREIFGPDVTDIRILGYPTGHGWRSITKAELRKIETAQQIAVSYDGERGRGCIYCTWRPPRRRNESPVQYYKRTRCVDDNHLNKHRGFYYCNPAHCSHRWKDKDARDAHVRSAYCLLD